MTDDEVKAVAEALNDLWCPTCKPYSSTDDAHRAYCEKTARAAISKLDEMRGPGEYITAASAEILREASAVCSRLLTTDADRAWAMEVAKALPPLPPPPEQSQ